MTNSAGMSPQPINCPNPRSRKNRSISCASLIAVASYLTTSNGTERQRSPAAGSRSDAGADAGGSQVQRETVSKSRFFSKMWSDQIKGMHSQCCKNEGFTQPGPSLG